MGARDRGIGSRPRSWSASSSGGKPLRVASAVTLIPIESRKCFNRRPRTWSIASSCASECCRTFLILIAMTRAQGFACQEWNGLDCADVWNPWRGIRARRHDSGSTPGYGIGGCPRSCRSRLASATTFRASTCLPSSRKLPRTDGRTRLPSSSKAVRNGREGQGSAPLIPKGPVPAGGDAPAVARLAEPEGWLSLAALRGRRCSTLVHGKAVCRCPKRSMTTRTHAGGSGSRKSASVTNPPLSSSIRRRMEPTGVRSPLRYR